MSASRLVRSKRVFEICSRDAGSTTSDMQSLQSLIRQGASVNYVQGPDGISTLMVAAEHGHVAYCQFLMKAGALLLHKDKAGRNVLHYAARGGNADTFAFLYKGIMKVIVGREPTLKLEQFVNGLAAGSNTTPLMEAAAAGHDQIIAFLYKHADVQLLAGSKRDNTTALHLAARFGRVNCIDALCELYGLSSKLSAIRRSDNGWTAVHEAAYHGHLAALETFARLYRGENKALLLDSTDHNGVSPCHLAISQGHLQAVRFLLANGCNIHLCDAQKRNACHFAVQSGSVEMVRSVLPYLTPQALTAYDNTGFAPIHWSCIHGSADCVRVLVEDGGADVNMPDEQFQRTLLHYAMLLGHQHLTSFLLQMPTIDVNLADVHGHSPIHYGVAYGQTEIVELLVKNGGERQVELLRKDNELGATPLHWAVAANEMRSVELILTYGPALWSSSVRKAYVKNRYGVDERDRLEFTASQQPHKKQRVPYENPQARRFRLTTLLNAVDSQGRTPLHIAALCGRRECVDSIFCRDNMCPAIEWTKQDTNGWTVLHACAAAKHAELLGVLTTTFCREVKDGLRKLGTIRDARGRTVLHLLCESGSVECLQAFESAVQRVVFDAKADTGAKIPLLMDASTASSSKAATSPSKAVVIRSPSGRQVTVAAGHTRKQWTSYCTELMTLWRETDTSDHLPIYYLIIHRHTFLLEYVLQQVYGTEDYDGLRLFHRDKEGRHALHYVVRLGFDDVLDVLLRQPRLIDGIVHHRLSTPGEHGYTLLHEAASFPSPTHARIVDTLLSIPGIDVYQPNSFGRTAAHIACSAGNPSALQSLLSYELRHKVPGDQQPLLKLRDGNGHTVMHVAISTGNVELLSAIFTYIDSLDGDDVGNIADWIHQPDTECGVFPIHAACYSRMQTDDRTCDVLDRLVQFVDTYAKRGLGRLEISELVTVRDRHGWTPLHYCAVTGKAVSLSYLSGFVLGQRQMSPTHSSLSRSRTAVFGGHCTVADHPVFRDVDDEVHLSHGHLRDYSRNSALQVTALHLVGVSGSVDAAAELLQYIPVDTCDGQGWTVLQWALEHQRRDLSAYLVDKVVEAGVVDVLFRGVVDSRAVPIESDVDYSCERFHLYDDSYTPLTMAIVYGQCDILRKMLEAISAADLHPQSVLRPTILLATSHLRNEESLKALRLICDIVDEGQLRMWPVLLAYAQAHSKEDLDGPVYEGLVRYMCHRCGYSALTAHTVTRQQNVLHVLMALGYADAVQKTFHVAVQCIQRSSSTSSGAGQSPPRAVQMGLTAPDAFSVTPGGYAVLACDLACTSIVLRRATTEPLHILNSVLGLASNAGNSLVALFESDAVSPSDESPVLGIVTQLLDTWKAAYFSKESTPETPNETTAVPKPRTQKSYFGRRKLQSRRYHACSDDTVSCLDVALFPLLSPTMDCNTGDSVLEQTVFDTDRVDEYDAGPIHACLKRGLFRVAVALLDFAFEYYASEVVAEFDSVLRFSLLKQWVCADGHWEAKVKALEILLDCPDNLLTMGDGCVFRMLAMSEGMGMELRYKTMQLLVQTLTLRGYPFTSEQWVSWVLKFIPFGELERQHPFVAHVLATEHQHGHGRLHSVEDSVLYPIVRGQHTELLEVFIRGINTHAFYQRPREGHLKWTCVHEIVAVGDPFMMETVLKVLASASHSPLLIPATSEGITPVHLAAQVGNAGILRTMLEYTAQSSQTEHFDRTSMLCRVLFAQSRPRLLSPLMIAIAMEHSEVFDVLVEFIRLLNFADRSELLSIGDVDGFAPVHYCFCANRQDLAELLMELGANRHSRNRMGQLPVECSVDYEPREIPSFSPFTSSTTAHPPTKVPHPKSTNTSTSISAKRSAPSSVLRTHADSPRRLRLSLADLKVGASAEKKADGVGETPENPGEDDTGEPEERKALAEETSNDASRSIDNVTDAIVDEVTAESPQGSENNDKDGGDDTGGHESAETPVLPKNDLPSDISSKRMALQAALGNKTFEQYLSESSSKLQVPKSLQEQPEEAEKPLSFSDDVSDDDDVHDNVHNDDVQHSAQSPPQPEDGDEIDELNHSRQSAAMQPLIHASIEALQAGDTEYIRMAVREVPRPEENRPVLLKQLLLEALKMQLVDMVRELCAAVRETGDIDILRDFVDDGWTLLHVAVSTADITIIEEVLDTDFDIVRNSEQFVSAANVTEAFPLTADDQDLSMVHIAISTRSVEVLEKVIDAYLLHMSAGSPDTSGVDAEKMLRRGLERVLEQRNSDGLNGLHTASLMKSSACIDKLLSLGISPNSTDSALRTALHWVAVPLSEVETSLDTADSVDSETSVCVQLLLDAGVELHRSDVEGRTALHIAAVEDNVAVLKELMALPTRRWQALLKTTDVLGYTPLMLAVSRQSLQCLPMLLECQAVAALQSPTDDVWASFSTRDDSHNLGHLAVCTENVDIVRQLCHYVPADSRLWTDVDVDGLTAFDLATECEMHEVADAIADHVTFDAEKRDGGRRSL